MGTPENGQVQLCLFEVPISLFFFFFVKRVAFDEYLKNVRSLSCKQFYHCVTAAKVRIVQMQSQNLDYVSA